MFFRINLKLQFVLLIVFVSFGIFLAFTNTVSAQTIVWADNWNCGVPAGTPWWWEVVESTPCNPGTIPGPGVISFVDPIAPPPSGSCELSSLSCGGRVYLYTTGDGTEHYSCTDVIGQGQSYSGTFCQVLFGPGEEWYTPAGPTCNNDVCEDWLGENYLSCPADCSAPPPYIDVVINSPTSKTVTQGALATYSVSVISRDGMSGTVNMSSYYACPNYSCSFSPSSVNVPLDGVANTTFQIQTTSNTPTNTYSVGVTGNWNGTNTNGLGGLLTVNPVPSAPLVTLTADSTNIPYNSATTLRWTISNATSCSGTNMPAGNWSTGQTGSASTGSLTATRTYYLDCTGPGGNTQRQVTVIVQPQPRPDLTISNISPTGSVTAGNVNFSGRVNNTGNASAGASQTRIQVDLGSNGWTISEPQQTFSTNAIAAGGTSSPNPSWTINISTTGTHRYQICADSASQVDEGVNENNNCSPWQSFTVNSASAAEADIKATNVTQGGSPTSGTLNINSGDTVSITWCGGALPLPGNHACVNASSCTVTGGASPWTGTSGSRTGAITSDRTYTLTCYNSIGTPTTDAVNIVVGSGGSPVNGACGTAAKTYGYAVGNYSVPPDTFCASGTASPATPAFPAQGSSIPWTCLGQNGGSPASCQANRTTPPASLEVHIDKVGQGTVTSVPGGINCGSDCDEEYDEDTTVILTADAAPGRIFVRWTGDCSGTNEEFELLVDSAKTCTANFAIDPTYKEF